MVLASALRVYVDRRPSDDAVLRELGAQHVSELDGEPEDMVFALPKELRLQLIG